MGSRREVIGLDIGTHSAKAVNGVLRMGRVVFKGAAWVRLPHDEDGRRRVLASFVERNGWRGLPTVAPLGGKSVMLHTIDIDPNDPRRVDRIVAMEMEQFNGLADERTVSDYSLQATPSGGRCVFMAVGRLEGVDAAMRMRTELGFDVIDVIPGASALFNSVCSLGCRTGRPYACVDLGHDGTEVVVGHRRHVVFARRFHRGASAFPEALRSPGAEDGGEGWPPAGDEAVDPRVAQWIGELKSCLLLYDSQFPAETSRPQRIVLCGGGAFTADLARFVERATGIETVALGSLGGVGRLDDAARYAKAAGLVMAGLGKGHVGMSLLPRHVKERQTLRRQRPNWIAGCAAIAVAVVLVVVTTAVDLSRKKTTLNQLMEQLSEHQRLGDELQEYRQDNESLYRQVLPLRCAARNGILVRSVVQALSGTKHPDDWITLIADADSYFASGQVPMDPLEERPSKDEGTLPLQGTAMGRLVVEGYTPVADLSTVRAMIEGLRTNPAISDADLLGDDQVRFDELRDIRWAGADCRLFAVEVTLVRP